jgi:transposase
MGRPLLYRVELSVDQVQRLDTLTRKGKQSARVIRRAHTLLLAQQGVGDVQIAATLNITVLTVRNTRKTFVQQGLEATLYGAPRPGRPVKFDGTERAAITALACTEAPAGHARWSVRLIADRAVELQLVDGIAPSTVFYILKKTSSSCTANGSGASRS